MDRPPTDDLTALFAAIASDPQRWDFFAAGRAVEAADPGRPRIGESLEPGQEAIDLEHQADFNFPRTTIAEFQGEGRRPALKSQHLGMTGPMGPLPSHLTEIAVYERARRGPKPFNDFLDLLTARPLQQFYRAWANADPCANAERPGDDLFAGYLGAVAGTTDLAFLRPDARPALGDASHFDDWRRLPYGGHLAALRAPGAIGALLSDLLGRPVTVTEAIGRWRPIPDDQRSRLGRSDSRLGHGATLGGRFWSVEYDVAFSIRAKSMADLEDLLPGGRAHRLLAEAARAALPHHIDWRARVAISEHLIKPARLGGKGANGATRLGWTSWMAPRGHVRLRHDLTIHERIITAHAGPEDGPAMEDAA
jgi:type VI secretion system protein ImpH